MKTPHGLDSFEKEMPIGNTAIKGIKRNIDNLINYFSTIGLVFGY